MSTCRHLYLGMACGQPAEYVTWWTTPLCGVHARALDAVTKGEAPFLRDPEAAAIARIRRADYKAQGWCVNHGRPSDGSSRCVECRAKRRKPKGEQP